MRQTALIALLAYTGSYAVPAGRWLRLPYRRYLHRRVLVMIWRAVVLTFMVEMTRKPPTFP